MKNLKKMLGVFAAALSTCVVLNITALAIFMDLSPSWQETILHYTYIFFALGVALFTILPLWFFVLCILLIIWTLVWRMLFPEDFE